MCGINGFISNNHNIKTKNIIESMNKCIIHRGPDDSGTFVDISTNNSIGMSMRRLSIIDLKQGNQPIFSDDGNLVIVFNGEIYNYLELKKILKNDYNLKFKTSSDTEVILKLYEIYQEKGFHLLDGMYAFSIFDKKLNKVIIARDYFGEKPLYYYMIDDKFYWASELKSIIKVIENKPKICKQGLSLYFQLTYIPSPYTIYENIKKLEADHYLEIDLNKFNIKKFEIKREKKIKDENQVSFNDAKQKTFDLVMKSVKSRAVSDVPVGAFLSGGVDSSIISLCHSLNQTNKIDTFSLGFKNKSFDESKKFRTVAKLIKSNHHEIFIDIKNNKINLDKILLNYDEPFADSSAIPTYLISKYTSNSVKVVLSGDGGDEVFGGYNKYLMGNINTAYTRFVPKNSHKILNTILNKILIESKDNRGLKYKLKRVINSIDYDGNFYKKIISLGFSNIELSSFLKEDLILPTLMFNMYQNKEETISDFRDLDKIISLEGDMLVKVDRATMLNSLECRAPFLNYDLWNFTSNLPDKYLLNFWNKKYLLKESFKNFFPKNFLDKPKQGFAIPIGDWLRTNFKLELLSYIENGFLIKQNIFNVLPVQKLVLDHVESKTDNTFKVWTFFCFQKWYINSFIS